MSARNVLFCSYYAPQADRDSGSGRMLSLIQALKDDGWGVSFAASTGIGDLPSVTALRQQGVLIYDASMHSMEGLLTTFSFDLIVFAFWPTAEFYLPVVRRCSPGSRVIVDSIDLNFLRESRRTFYEGKSGGGGLLDEHYASQMIAEINTYAAADGVLAISRKEEGWIADLIGDPELVYTVPLGDARRQSPIPFPDRSGIVFVGNFNHPPNVEAVRVLCEDVLPKMDQRLLEAHPVYIVGNAMNDTVRNYGQRLPYVRMVGWVPSIEPYLERARVSVLPLTYGAGIKGKLVQALMTGTPSVSTRVGTEGLELQNGEHVLVADDPADFAAAVSRLLTERKLWEHLAREGRKHADGKYSRETEQKRFRDAISAVFKKNTKPAILPEISLARFRERLNHNHYLLLMPRIREAMHQAVPLDATVIVGSEGNGELLKLAGRKTWHFLQSDAGTYQPGYHANSEVAIAQLEALRARGGEFLLLPRSAFWGMDPAAPLDDKVTEELGQYRRFTAYLDEHYRHIPEGREICAIYDLRNGNGHHAAAHAAGDAGATHSLPAISARVRQPHPGHGIDRAARLIAFYLPQFHPIPENDAWWGEGFTEWTNVTKAQPLFRGHHQPHLPADLGFYDLRLAETREDQARLANAAGLHGFCYYHYWFHGKPLLERPFNDVLRSGKPDFPFCLCWANEPWSRRWDGRARDVLQTQSYSDKDDVAHIRALLPALKDRRAITIEDKPAFLVYKARDLPDPAHTAAVWRREVSKAGLAGIYLIAVETGADEGWDATEAGFDAKVLFQPSLPALFNSGTRVSYPERPDLRVFDYQKAWPILSNPNPVNYRRYETVTPRWDNTARMNETALVLQNSTPDAYEEWLRQSIERVQNDAPDHRIVFINAWNEWGEGSHLEPDLEYGHAYLDATARALDAVRGRMFEERRHTGGHAAAAMVPALEGRR